MPHWSKKFSEESNRTLRKVLIFLLKQHIKCWQVIKIILAKHSLLKCDDEPVVKNLDIKISSREISSRVWLERRSMFRWFWERKVTKQQNNLQEKSLHSSIKTCNWDIIKNFSILQLINNSDWQNDKRVYCIAF